MNLMNEKPKVGRPEIKIDWAKVDSYLKAQCNGTGIAGIIGVHPNTLYLKCEEDNKISFSEYSAQKKIEGQELLRAKQHLTAMEGNVTMQIWLGKQYLEQRDKSEVSGQFEFIEDQKEALRKFNESIK
jgi:hypothetical protein